MKFRNKKTVLTPSSGLLKEHLPDCVERKRKLQTLKFPFMVRSHGFPSFILLRKKHICSRKNMQSVKIHNNVFFFFSCSHCALGIPFWWIWSGCIFQTEFIFEIPVMLVEIAHRFLLLMASLALEKDFWKPLFDSWQPCILLGCRKDWILSKCKCLVSSLSVWGPAACSFCRKPSFSSNQASVSRLASDRFQDLCLLL